MDGVKSFSFILQINFTYTCLSQLRVIMQNYVERKTKDVSVRNDVFDKEIEQNINI